MNHPFLKIAGVDSLDKFYEMFPDEATFMAKYGKKVEKLLKGGAVKKAQPGIQTTIAPSPFQIQTYDVTGGQGDLRQTAANSINTNIIQNRRNNLRQGIGLNSQQDLMDESIENPNFIQNLYSGFSELDPKNAKKAVNATGTINQNITKISDAIATKKFEKEKNKQLKAFQPLIAQAASSVSEPIERNYLRPDTNQIEPYTLNNPMGSGPGLYAKKGAEIANTFAPNTIYTDLEQAQTGAEMALITEGINMTGDQAAWLLSRNTKKFQRENEKMMSQMGMQPGIQGLQSPYVSHMKHGGFVNPQVATSLEGIPMKKLFAPDPTMDTLRTGGHIRQNNISAMDGNIKATWGGQLQPISYNPYQAGSGQTVLGFGNYHDQEDENGRTGIGLSVGNKNSNPMMDYAEYGTEAAEMNSNVEFEPEEPIIEQANPEGGTSVVVLGNQKLTRETAKIMGDSKLAGKKINKVGLDIALMERNINDKMQKSAIFLSELNANNPYDKLTQSGLQAAFKGYDIKLKKLADDKLKLTAIQDFTNQIDKEGEGFDYKQLIDEGNLVSASKKAKMGAKITTAQKGITKDQMSEFEKLKKSGNTKALQEYMYQIAPDIIDNIIKENKLPRAGVWADDQFGFRTKLAEDQIRERFYSKPVTGDVANGMRPGATNFINQYAGNKFQLNGIEPIDYASDITFKGDSETSDQKVDWFDVGRDAYNQVVRPFILPSDVEGLDFGQVAPEYMALADQVEPVRAQKVPLRLMSPQNISYADQLGQVQSDYRAAQRMMQGNAAAQSILAAEKAKQSRGILGEEFRANQAMRDAVQSANLEAMRQNDMANLGLLDEQYVRQQQAISNTKAVKQAALNSINAKIAQNRLANRQLQMYENLYGFRSDKQGRMYNVNPLAEFNMQGSGSSTTPGIGGMDIEDLEYALAVKKLQDKKQKKLAKDTQISRNGSIVAATKKTNL